MLLLIQHSRLKVSYSAPQKMKIITLWDTNPRFQIDTMSLYYKNYAVTISITLRKTF